MSYFHARMRVSRYNILGYFDAIYHITELGPKNSPKKESNKSLVNGDLAIAISLWTW
jgi:hypothetical protein